MQGMQPNGDNGWNGRDDVSFEDSERFEEDSQVSLDDSIDGSQQNWRGWADSQSNCEAIQPGISCLVYQYHNTSGRFSSASTRTVVPGNQNNSMSQHPMMTRGDDSQGTLLTLSEIAARVCAEKWSFQKLEEMYAHVCNERAIKLALPPPTTTIPEKIFLSFIVHCFPQSTDEIRMYSTLANGSSEQYEFGSTLYEWGHVCDVSQTGFLLSGNVSSSSQVTGRHAHVYEKDQYHVTVKVDRCRIVECTCECSNRSSWCKHVVALCIYRITQRSQIKFNETIADAINSMSDFDLRRLVQWHINEIPRKCIPGFQKLIDQIKDPDSMINRLHGAPDPTDGGHEPVSRYDFPEIENKVRRLLCKYCVPAPSVHCDVTYLTTSAPHPTYTEWNAMMKPYRNREPEGMWNLIQMVREMFARNDDNAVALLRTITDECLSNNQILLWWYITKLMQSGHWIITNPFKMPYPQPLLSQLNCAELLDEVVVLWKLVAINPRADKNYRSQLVVYLQDYHRTAVNRLKSMIAMTPPTADDANPKTDATILSNHQTSAILQTINNDVKHSLSAVNMKFTLNSFPGFYPAIQMCHYLNDKDIKFGVRTDAIFYVSAPNTSNGYKLVPPVKDKILKKKKKKKKLLKKMEEEANTRRLHEERMDQYQGIDGIWRVVPDDHAMNIPQNDSTESGQESDIQKTPAQTMELPQKKKKNTDSVEMEVNEVLAAAFTPLDTLETRFLRVEAYGTHGFRADAVDYSLKVVEYLIDSLTEQSVDFRRFEDDLDKDTPSTSTKPISSSSSATSDITGANIDDEVAKGNLFLATMEKILYVTKVLRDSPHLQRTVFDIAIRTLSVTKWPMYTKHQQIYSAYLETEFVAILDQLWQSVPMGEVQMEQIRSKAQDFVNIDHGENGELPPLALTKFLFLALYWTEPNNPPARPPQNAPATASAVLQQNRRLLSTTDSDLALHCALTVVGCRPRISDRYVLHWETIRRDKSELTSLLLTRYKDSQEKCALIIDKILDPKMHRMYQHHLSNGAYFLERCPAYIKRFKPGQRPIFPYKEEQSKDNEAGDDSDESSDPFVDYEAQIDAELQKMSFSDSGEEVAGPLSREQRVSHGSVESTSSDFFNYSNQQSAPSTSRSNEYVDYNPAYMPGLTKENRETYNALRQTQGLTNPPRRKRTVQSTQFDPRNLVTDAHVFHTFELAKKILFEAGGQQNTIIWGNQNVGGINRRLHLCAILIAVYALGMSNRISPSWNTRTYNLIACWVATQVQEVGSQAIEMIRQTWMAHFTPNEIANIADKSTPVNDPAMKHETAKLALSVLPFAHALTDDEVINAIKKCRDDSRNMLVAGLMALDTSQFRQIGRTRTLFTVMQYWHDLSYDEEPRNPPAGMVANPYANLVQFAASNQQQQHNQHQNRRHRGRRNVPYHLQVIPPLPQAAFLYPQAYDYSDSTSPIASTSYRSEIARMHQSHSAPQLGGNPGEAGSEMDHVAQPPVQMTNHLNMPQPSPNDELLNAYNYGMRGMDCMATSPGEERQMYLKFGPHPPYAEDLMCLFTVAKNLGGQYLYSFYSNAARSVISPYILHQYARESVAHFPPRMYNQPPPPQPPPQPPVQVNRVPIPLMNPTHNVAMFAQAPPNIRYPNVKFSLPGQITNLFTANGYQPVTGELFERCCEQYLQAIVNKMNSPRVNDHSDFLNQLVSFIQNAHDAFKWIPNISRQLFEDFIRMIKRQKSYRKECAQAVNHIIGQLCNQ